MIVLTVLVSFVLMEAVTYCAHRWVMHGIGWALHRSHHRRLARTSQDWCFEANDLFPVGFSAIAMLLFAIAIHWNPLLPVCWGISVYGAAYLFVHDLYIHERVNLPRRVLRFLEPLKQAHTIHHRTGKEPYGMLFPWTTPTIVPSARHSPREGTKVGDSR